MVVCMSVLVDFMSVSVGFSRCCLAEALAGSRLAPPTLAANLVFPGERVLRRPRSARRRRAFAVKIPG